MAFVLPTFPFRAYIWHAYDPTTSLYAAPDDSQFCNLSVGERMPFPYQQGFGGEWSNFGMLIMWPALTDVRGYHSVGPVIPPDLLELPKASGRFYKVNYVDDIAKGFANEHRFCTANMHQYDTVFADVTVPFPIPIP